MYERHVTGFSLKNEYCYFHVYISKITFCFIRASQFLQETYLFAFKNSASYLFITRNK